MDYKCTVIENFKGYSESVKIDCSIPCLFLRSFRKTKKIIIFFHGNAEDLGMVRHILRVIQAHIDAHIIAVEYPGYGVYSGTPNEENILKDSERVIQFVIKVLKWPIKNVISFGRSIGTGPAWALAEAYNIGSLVLMCPYTSIRGIAKDRYGSFWQYFIREQFDNLNRIKKVAWPTFILHGLKDQIIPYQHSEELALNWKGPTTLVLPANMDHNTFSFYEDLIKPLK